MNALELVLVLIVMVKLDRKESERVHDFVKMQLGLNKKNIIEYKKLYDTILSAAKGQENAKIVKD
jgi:hypothetical protein